MWQYEIKKIDEQTIMISECGLACMYLLWGEKSALLIDTGVGVGNLEELVRKFTRLPFRVVITHGHRDHAGGIGQFRKVFVHPKDKEAVRQITMEDRRDYIHRMCISGLAADESECFKSMQRENPHVEIADVFPEDRFDLGNREVTVLYTPGHTEGSVSFLDSRRILFAGDALQTIMLLHNDREDKNIFLRAWLDSLRGLMKQSDLFTMVAGGHGIVPKRKS